jgi:hypothetical protein
MHDTAWLQTWLLQVSKKVFFYPKFCENNIACKVTLMRIRIRFLIFIVDPDPAFHSDADLASQNDADQQQWNWAGHTFLKTLTSFHILCFRKSFQCECEEGWSGEGGHFQSKRKVSRKTIQNIAFKDFCQ